MLSSGLAIKKKNQIQIQILSHQYKLYFVSVALFSTTVIRSNKKPFAKMKKKRKTNLCFHLKIKLLEMINPRASFIYPRASLVESVFFLVCCSYNWIKFSWIIIFRSLQRTLTALSWNIMGLLYIYGQVEHKR